MKKLTKLAAGVITATTLAIPAPAQVINPVKQIKVNLTNTGVVNPARVRIDCKNLTQGVDYSVPLVFNNTGSTSVGFPLGTSSSCAFSVTATGSQISLKVGGFQTTGKSTASFVGYKYITNGNLVIYADGFVPVIDSTTVDITVTAPSLSVTSDNYTGNVNVYCNGLNNASVLTGSGFNGTLGLVPGKTVVLTSNEFPGLSVDTVCGVVAENKLFRVGSMFSAGAAWMNIPTEVVVSDPTVVPPTTVVATSTTTSTPVVTTTSEAPRPPVTIVTEKVVREVCVEKRVKVKKVWKKVVTCKRMS